MKSSTRIPRWKQVGVDRSGSKPKLRSERSRYNPKLSQSSSEKDFTLHCLQNSRNFSLTQNKEQRNKQNPFIRLDSPNSLSDKKQKKSDLCPSPQNKANTVYNEQPKNKKILYYKFETNMQKKNSTRPRDPIEDNFRDYLVVMENLERQFQEQKLAVEEKLNAQQKIIDRVKENIMETFGRYSSSFTDHSLKRLIVKHRQAKQALENTRKMEILGVDASGRAFGPRDTPQELSLKPRMKTSLNKNDKKRSVSRSIRSGTSEDCKNTFDRIFQTIQEMKKGLNEFKEIRISTNKKRGPRKTSFRIKKDYC